MHLRLALRHFGYAATVETLPDADEPDLLARLRLGSRRAPAPEENTLFDAIGKRRTNRQAFEQRAVPHSILLALQEAAQTEGAWFSLMQGEEDRNAVAGLIALGDHLQWADKHFRRELAAWAQTNPSHRRDRLPAFALNLGDALAQADLRAGRTFDLGNGQAVRDRQLAAGSPVLAVLGTDVDTAYDWLMAGQALARVLLSAHSQGVWASFFNQPIEVPEVRLMLHNLIERGGYPQLLLRMGYGPQVPPTPRRSVCEVLL